MHGPGGASERDGRDPAEEDPRSGATGPLLRSEVRPGPQGSIIQKIVLGIAVTILLVGAAVIVPAAWVYRSDLVRTEAEGARTVGALLAENAAGQPLEALIRASETHRAGPGLRTRVIAPDGRPVLPERIPAWLHRLIRLRLPGMLSANDRAWPWFEAGGRVHVLVPHRGPDGGIDGAIHVERSLDAANRHVLGYVLRSVGGILAAVVIIGAVAILSIWGVVLKPLEAMVEANRSITEGETEGALIPADAIPNDELGEMMRVRNLIYRRMLDYQASIREKNEVLERQRAELEGWRRELERRLAEKSAELVRAHEQLIRADKLAAIGRLAAGVAHEINNPLASILGYAEDLEDLEENDRETLLEELPASLEVIQEQALRCKRITKQLLNFARESEPSLEPVHVESVLEDTLPLVEHRARRAEVPVEVESGEDRTLVATDPSQLQQVLINLIDNAIDACSAKDGEAGVTLRTRSTGEEIVIEVEDEGTGIAPDDRSQVFDPFFTRKDDGKGTGLGLSICYGIVDRLRGRIEFDTTVGEGTTFRVFLPTILRGEEPESASSEGPATDVTGSPPSPDLR